MFGTEIADSYTTPSAELNTNGPGPSGPLAGPMSQTDRTSRGLTEVLVDSSPGIHLR
jgi:hypothetical protein